MSHIIPAVFTFYGSKTIFAYSSEGAVLFDDEQRKVWAWATSIYLATCHGSPILKWSESWRFHKPTGCRRPTRLVTLKYSCFKMFFKTRCRGVTKTATAINLILETFIWVLATVPLTFLALKCNDVHFGFHVFLLYRFSESLGSFWKDRCVYVVAINVDSIGVQPLQFAHHSTCSAVSMLIAHRRQSRHYDQRVIYYYFKIFVFDLLWNRKKFHSVFSVVLCEY